MLKDCNISFAPGNIITSKILETMFTYPRSAFELMLEGRSDGILNGMDIQVKDDDLIITKGVFKYKKHLYLLTEDQIIKGDDDGKFKDGRTYFLYIETEGDSLKTSVESEDYVDIFSAAIKLQSGELKDKCDKVILCSFKGKPRIPRDCRELLKGSCNFLSRCRSSQGEKTYQDIVCRAVYSKLNKKKDKHPLDYAIISEILTNHIISAELIREYIYEDTSEPCTESNDETLFKKFVKSMENLKMNLTLISKFDDNQDDTESKEPDTIWINK